MNEHATFEAGRDVSVVFAYLFCLRTLTDNKYFLYVFLHTWLFIFFYAAVLWTRTNANIADAFMCTLTSLVMKVWGVPSRLHYKDSDTWTMDEYILALDELFSLLLIFKLFVHVYNRIK